MDRIAGSRPIIQRICFNFQDMCNMSCPYCYIPFTREEVDLGRCIAVIERCASLGVKVITFGGGDPFLLREFPKLLKRSADLGMEIHVDTNGIKLSADQYNTIEETASLIALPLDGPTGSVHANMRGSEDHFKIVLGHLEGLADRTIRIKINTVVSRLNYQAIAEIGEILRLYRIDAWSLYQFWPLHDSVREKGRYDISDDLFTTVIRDIASSKYPFRVEPGPIRERYGTSIFVSHTGSLYIHDRDSESRYTVLGSILDEETITLLQRLNGNSIRERARDRYISLRSNLPVIKND